MGFHSHHLERNRFCGGKEGCLKAGNDTSTAGQCLVTVSSSLSSPEHDLLRTSPLEDYFYYNDLPNCPMTHWAAFKIKGVLDKTALETAISQVSHRHPLLLSTLVIRSGSRHFWKASRCPIPVHWLSSPLSIRELVLEYIDLTRQPGIMIKIFQGRENAWLYFLFHHTCTDGPGAMGGFFELFWQYNINVRPHGGLPGIRPANLESLKRRARLGLSRRAWIRRISRLRVSFKSCFSYLTRTPVPVQNLPPCSGPTPHRKPGAPTTGRLSREQTGALSALAKAQKVSLNSLLLAQLFIHIRWWKETNNRVDPTDILRIMVPASQRTFHNQDMGICNMVAPLFVTQQAGEVGQGRSYTRQIHDRVKHERAIQADLSFLLGLSVCRSVPGLLARTIRNNRLPTTAILSNVGNLTLDPSNGQSRELTLGVVTIQELEVVPPVWPNTQVVILVYTFAGQLRLSMSYDTLAFTAGEARRFLDAYCSRLEGLACQSEINGLTHNAGAQNAT